MIGVAHKTSPKVNAWKRNSGRLLSEEFLYNIYSLCDTESKIYTPVLTTGNMKLVIFDSTRKVK